ncbi:hypothetical protein ACFWWB_35840 [Streptomyces sp. NPDC058690]|uniref:hypothetical protein n=1 Tax=Streptomyces sp. NPDC058690 TaxID=3346600 RepID=UPI0036656CF7
MSDQPGRYRVTLVVDGRTVASGWWDSAETAARRFTRWIGERGSPGARITLVDTGEDRMLQAWP